MIRLGVNIDHVATLRQARYQGATGVVPEPDPVWAANEVELAGAHSFLAREAITVVREDLGGSQARRVDFRPARGQVRCRAVENTLAPQAEAMPRLPQHSGEVDLF